MNQAFGWTHHIQILSSQDILVFIEVWISVHEFCCARNVFIFFNPSELWVQTYFSDFPGSLLPTPTQLCCSSGSDTLSRPGWEWAPHLLSSVHTGGHWGAGPAHLHACWHWRLTTAPTPCQAQGHLLPGCQRTHSHFLPGFLPPLAESLGSKDCPSALMDNFSLPLPLAKPNRLSF